MDIQIGSFRTRSLVYFCLLDFLGKAGVKGKLALFGCTERIAVTRIGAHELLDLAEIPGEGEREREKGRAGGRPVFCFWGEGGVSTPVAFSCRIRQ